MSFKRGYKDKLEKEKLVLSILRKGAENKPEGNVRAYLFKIFDNQMNNLSALNSDPEQTKWENYLGMWQRGRWLVKDCPRPDDPQFKTYCPAKYQHLFEVKHE